MISQLLLTSLAAAVVPAAPLTESTDMDRVVAVLVDDEPAGVWKGNVSVGASLARGNTELTTLSASAHASYREDDFRHSVNAWWNYAEQETAAGDTELTQRRVGASYKYDYFHTETLYYNALAGVEADELANLDLRWFGGVGVGHVFFDEETRGFDGELGVVYFAESFETGDDNEYIAARAAWIYWNQINENVRFEQDMQSFPSLEDIEDFYGRLDNRVMIKMSDNMHAQLQYVFDYDNTPAPGAVRDDHRVIVGLGWDF